MSSAKRPKVLDVGQCDLDHGNISLLLRNNFHADVDRCHSADEALDAVRREAYDLILINRVFDRDGSEGLSLIQRLNDEVANKGGALPPVMLVSNFPDAQERAVQAGALRGFGKAALDAPDTCQRLRAVLGD